MDRCMAFRGGGLLSGPPLHCVCSGRLAYSSDQLLYFAPEAIGPSVGSDTHWLALPVLRRAVPHLLALPERATLRLLCDPHRNLFFSATEKLAPHPSDPHKDAAFGPSDCAAPPPARHAPGLLAVPCLHSLVPATPPAELPRRLPRPVQGLCCNRVPMRAGFCLAAIRYHIVVVLHRRRHRNSRQMPVAMK